MASPPARRTTFVAALIAGNPLIQCVVADRTSGVWSRPPPHKDCSSIGKTRISVRRVAIFENVGIKMLKLVPGSVLTVFVLAALVCQPAFADGMTSRKHHRAYRLAPGRHVVEVVQPPYSGNFIINGARFVGQTPACLRWVAGDRVRLF